MNFKVVRYFLSRMLMIESGLMVIPLLVGLIYRESFSVINSFILTIVITFFIGLVLGIKVENHKDLHTKEGMVIVALTWILWSVFGALPFVIANQIPHMMDAVFEMSSGFTTTGASILTDVEALSHAHLFWRSFSNFIGGMGVLVFALAIFPKGSSETVHLMRAEVPGPTFGKLVSKIRNTAIILYAIYMVLTAITVVLLVIGKMNLFDALCHAFGIAGTGGFSTHNASIGYFQSPYIEWISGVMMLMFGMNFNLYYLILIGQVIDVIKNEELRIYLAVVGIATTILVISNTVHQPYSLRDNIRHSFFAVSSVITTSGFVTVDFSQWALTTTFVIAAIMFIGGMAGSTGGGFKVARFGVFAKSAGSELKLIKNPRRVSVVKFNGKPMEEYHVNRIQAYFIIYIIFLSVVFFLISLEDGIDYRTAFSAAMNTFNNIGAGFATNSASESFAAYTYFSKIVLSISMIAGRLEIYPILVLFSPSTYLKRS